MRLGREHGGGRLTKAKPAVSVVGDDVDVESSGDGPVLCRVADAGLLVRGNGVAQSVMSGCGCGG